MICTMITHHLMFAAVIWQKTLMVIGPSDRLKPIQVKPLFTLIITKRTE